MKKCICWLLLATLLLGGCVKTMPVTEDKTDINAAQQQETATEAPAVEDTEPTAGPETEPPVTVTAEPASEISVPADQEPTESLLIIEDYAGFVNHLSATLIDGKNNKNISPLSVYFALAMTAEGAKGQTQKELLALLGEKDIEDLRRKTETMIKNLCVAGKSGELALANSIWLGTQDKDVSFHDEYLNILAANYDAVAEGVPFGNEIAGKKISAWIEEKTRNKVKVSKDAMEFDAATLAVLINTIYLKDGWRVPFEKFRTEKGTFYGLGGKEMQVEYMQQTVNYGTIVRGSGYLRYAMPLKELGTVVFVLPDEGVSLESLLGSPEKIQELLNGGEAKTAEVNIKLPKFTFQDRTDLEDALVSLGVRTCFTDAADFSAMTDTPACISRVLQESCIGVDENGVVAAAYTMVVMSKSESISEKQRVNFHLTRPFLYAIESQDGTVLFIGTVTTPDEAQ